MQNDIFSMGMTEVFTNIKAMLSDPGNV